MNNATWPRAGTQVQREENATKVRRVVIVDLNNFATFPTLAIGLLTAALRDDGFSVQVICPLAHDVVQPPRERRETVLDHLQRRLHLSTHPLARLPRSAARKLRTFIKERPHPTILREVERALEPRPDIVLLSAYLQHQVTVREICHIAQSYCVPVLLGGPMFAEESVARAWSSLPGLAGIVGAEVDRDLSALVAAVCEGRDIAGYSGVTGQDGARRTISRPLRKLDDTPIPDFRDFPWARYPVRIIPVMSGRGCQWDKCLFCSDVISTSGRTFRSRSLDSLLAEMQEQARRHETRNFLFLDLKLNSNPDTLRGIAATIQDRIPGAEWIGTVHVDLRRDNGLSRADLEGAVAGGMRRISFGLETGSQRLLDLMQKGSSVEANSEFIRNAHEAGLSIRCTMFKGFPGETAEDMEQTAQFLEAHAPYLDRVRMNDFTVHVGTPIHRALAADAALQGLGEVNAFRALAVYDNPGGPDRAYRQAKARALRAVYEINRRPVREEARQFDGLM